jgi:hypothetical protein
MMLARLSLDRTEVRASGSDGNGNDDSPRHAGPFYRLEEAIAAARAGPEEGSVVALDVKKQAGGYGKSFYALLPGPARRRRLLRLPGPLEEACCGAAVSCCIYDVVPADRPCRLYIDLDADPVANEGGPSAGEMTRRLLAALEAFLVASGGLLRVLWAFSAEAAGSKRKLSQHVYVALCTGGEAREVPAASPAECGALMRSLDVWCRGNAVYGPDGTESLYVRAAGEWREQMEQERAETADDETTRVCWHLKWRFAADLAVYTRNRQMRTFLSDKAFCGRPLVHGRWHGPADGPPELAEWLLGCDTAVRVRAAGGENAVARLHMVAASVPSQGPWTAASTWRCGEPGPAAEPAKMTSNVLRHLGVLYGGGAGTDELFLNHFRYVYWPRQHKTLAEATADLVRLQEGVRPPSGCTPALRYWVWQLRSPGKLDAGDGYFVVAPLGQVYRASKGEKGAYPAPPVDTSRRRATGFHEYIPDEGVPVRLHFDLDRARQGCSPETWQVLRLAATEGAASAVGRLGARWNEWTAHGANKWSEHAIAPGLALPSRRAMRGLAVMLADGAADTAIDVQAARNTTLRAPLQDTYEGDRRLEPVALMTSDAQLEAHFYASLVCCGGGLGSDPAVEVLVPRPNWLQLAGHARQSLPPPPASAPATALSPVTGAVGCALTAAEAGAEAVSLATLAIDELGWSGSVNGVRRMHAADGSASSLSLLLLLRSSGRPPCPVHGGRVHDHVQHYYVVTRANGIEARCHGGKRAPAGPAAMSVFAAAARSPAFGSLLAACQFAVPSPLHAHDKARRDEATHVEAVGQGFTSHRRVVHGDLLWRDLAGAYAGHLRHFACQVPAAVCTLVLAVTVPDEAGEAGEALALRTLGKLLRKHAGLSSPVTVVRVPAGAGGSAAALHVYCPGEPPCDARVRTLLAAYLHETMRGAAAVASAADQGAVPMLGAARHGAGDERARVELVAGAWNCGAWPPAAPEGSPAVVEHLLERMDLRRRADETPLLALPERISRRVSEEGPRKRVKRAP